MIPARPTPPPIKGNKVLGRNQGPLLGGPLRIIAEVRLGWRCEEASACTIEGCALLAEDGRRWKRRQGMHEGSGSSSSACVWWSAGMTVSTGGELQQGRLQEELINWQAGVMTLSKPFCRYKGTPSASRSLAAYLC